MARKALARACRCQKQLDEGVYASINEIGYAGNISKNYASRILRLALQAPDIGLHTATLLTSSVGMR
jgi:hypothetical protein